MMTSFKLWWRRFTNQDYPYPEAGQLWVSGYNGQLLKVGEVEVHDCGETSVTCYRWYGQSRPIPWGIGQTYHLGRQVQANWCRILRARRSYRTYINPEVSVPDVAENRD